MKADDGAHSDFHRLDEIATQLTEPRWGAPAGLPVLWSMGPQRPDALPEHPTHDPIGRAHRPAAR